VLPDWVNQVPTASGLVSPTNDRHRNIDLVHRLAPGRYEFIELKLGSDTPLTAVMELLQYWSLYLFARRNYRQLGSRPEMLDADQVHLRVLAPQPYYNRYDLRWLEPEINAAVKGIGKNCGILVDLAFQAFAAAMLGLPYAFASHFAPDALMPALETYRARFEPSQQRAYSYAMVGCGVVVAETDSEAQYLFTSSQQRVANMFRGVRGLLQPPIDDIESYWTSAEKQHAQRMLACSFVGSVETVRRELQDFVARTKADELMVTCGVYDHGAKLHSYDLLAKEIAPSLTKEPALA
jgi:hypothetical protein